VHPREESKKLNIARGGQKKKNYRGEKQNSSTSQGVSIYLPKLKMLL
jgi:hypothetical protein